MEKEGYRETLEFLMKRYPDKVSFSPREVAEIMDCNLKTVYSSLTRRRDPIPHKRVGKKIVIPLTALARWMS